MRIIHRELVKTAPADAMISNRQSINIPASSRPSPRLSCRVGGVVVACSAGVLFPVVFVLFRSAPELSNSFGIMRFNCGFPLACLADGGAVPFSFLIHRLGFPRCSCHVLSCDVIGDVISLGGLPCLPYRVMSSPVVIRFAFPLPAPHRLALSPRRACRGAGSD